MEPINQREAHASEFIGCTPKTIVPVQGNTSTNPRSPSDASDGVVHTFACRDIRGTVLSRPTEPPNSPPPVSYTHLTLPTICSV